MNAPKRIFLIQTAFIGDAVLSTPLPRAVKELYPEAELDLVLTPQTEIIYRRNPDISKIYVFQKSSGWWRKLRSLSGIIRALRERRYDVALSVHVSFTSSLIMLLSGAPIRIGYPRQKFATARVSLPSGYPMHKRSLLLLGPLTDRVFDLSTRLYIPPESAASIEAFLKQESLNPEKLVALAPGSIWATKRWPQEFFAELIRGLHNAGWQCVVLGGNSDNDLCAGILKAAQTPAINAAGRFDLITSAELIRRSRLLICNDSGPLHIANAVQTPVLAIMGPTRTPGFLPYREHDRMVEIDLYCRPCGKHGHQKCPEGHWRCMREILPERVLQQALEMLR